MVNQLDTESKSVNEIIDYFTEGKRLRAQNFSYEYYIDSSSLEIIVGGLLAYTEGKDITFFERNQTLLYAFIYAGWLGKIHLLAPHREEFVDRIQTDNFSFPDSLPGTFKSSLIGFLERLEIKSLESDLKFLKQKSESPDFFKHLSIGSQTILKAQFLTNQPAWQMRLGRLINEETIDFDQRLENLEEITSSELFTKLLEEFNDLRPTKTINNITDSIALTLFSKKLKNFRSTSKVPVFYCDKNSKMLEIVKKPNFVDDFSIKLDKKPKLFVFRDWRFFILQAIYESNNYSNQILQKIEDERLVKLLGTSSGHEEIELKKDRIFHQMTDRFDREIVENFWIKKNAYKEINSYLNNITNIDVLLDVKRYRETLDKDKLAQIELLTKEISLLGSFNRIFNELTLKNRSDFGSQFDCEREKYEVLLNFGMIRFGIGKQIANLVDKSIKNLFESLDDKSKKNKYLISISSQLAEQNPTSKNFKVSISILWILGFYGLIIKILDKWIKDESEKDLDLSLILIYSACLAKNAEVKELNHLLDSIKLKASAQTSIGLSYTYFVLWYENLPDNFYRSFKVPTTAKRNRADKYLDEALNYAEEAINEYERKKEKHDLENEEMISYYYAINLIVYYVSVGADNDKFATLSRYIDKLEAEWEQNQFGRYWQSRFSDTLAVYYIRKAINTPNRGLFKDYKTTALYHSHIAIENTVELKSIYEGLNRRIKLLEFK